MAGYLTVTDDMRLTPAGAKVVTDSLPNLAAMVPGYAGTSTRARSWAAPFYNQESKAVSTIRGRIASALYAGADVHIVHIGDSKTNGSGPNTGKAYVDAYPSVFRRMLGAVEGVIPAFPGGNQWDDRWSATNLRAPYDAVQMGLVPFTGGTGPYTVTFNADFPHLGGTFWVNAPSGASIKVTVDGGAPQTITVPAGNGLNAVTPATTGTKAHSYRLETPNPIHLATFNPTYDGPRLKISRVGQGGSTAPQWVPGYKAEKNGLWDSLRTTTPDAVIVGIGTNSPQGQAEMDAIKTVYAAAVGLGVPVVAIAPGGLGGTGGLRPLADYYPMYQALWDAADRHDIPLIDFQSVIGDWPTANAAGLMGDTVHESRSGYAYEAAALAKLLAVPAAP